MTLLYSLLLSTPPIRAKLTALLLIISLSFLLTTYLALHLFSAQRPRSTEATHVLHTHTVGNSLSYEEIQSHLHAKTVCRFHTCFEINNCLVTTGDRMGVFVYPEAKFVVEETGDTIPLFSSVEYRELIESVRNSRYYVEEVSKACVFVPAVDTLTQDMVEVGDMSLVLHSLPL